MVAPHWSIVSEEDLNQEPYASPLLLRSVCLLSAHLAGASAKTLVDDITESIHQCFDAYELLSLPTVTTLQSILLLLASPRFSQSSMMTASVCRTALTLGLHRPQHPRPVLYWSCIVAARWESLRDPMGQSSDSVCFDLASAQPHTEPDPGTVFGALYHFLACADKRRRHLNEVFDIYQARCLRTPELMSLQQAGGDPPHGSEAGMIQSLLRLLAQYLSNRSGSHSSSLAVVTDELPAFHVNPFYDARHWLLHDGHS